MYDQCLHHIVTKKKINFYHEGIKNVHSFSYTMLEVTEIYAGQIILILMPSFNVKYLYIFHGGVTFHIVTSSLICRANQWTGFYMIRTSVIKELKAIMYYYLLVSRNEYIHSSFFKKPKFYNEKNTPAENIKYNDLLKKIKITTVASPRRFHSVAVSLLDNCSRMTVSAC